MGYNRNIVTKISPEMEQINVFLKGPFQESLNRYDLRYERESDRQIKTGKTYDDQIRIGAKRNFWHTNNQIVADLRRNVSDKKNISLEVRVLNPLYSKIIPEAVERCYKDLALTGQNINIAVYVSDK